MPGKVLEVRGNTAKVDFGYGATRDVDVTLVDAEEGQYVLVHVGYAIQVLDARARIFLCTQSTL